MNKWEKVVEEGMEIWVHEELGNIYKAGEGNFVAMLPKVLKFGPFKTVEEAQALLENKRQEMNQAFDLLNEQLLGR